MNSSLPNISVIICAYTEERWDDLAAAITSVQGQTLAPHEIIVVIDNNDTLRRRVAATFPTLLVLSVGSLGGSTRNGGVAVARNAGIAVATGEVIAFLDDDAEALPTWLAELQHGYADEHVIAVGGAIMPRWPVTRPSWFPDEFDWVVGCTYRGMPTEPAFVRNLIGANMSFRRCVFEQVLMYSGIGHIGDRPLGGSDPDFCIRVQRAFPRHALLYRPQAQVYHRVSVKRVRWNYFWWRCYNEGLSKSLLTNRVGSKDALSQEWTYTRRTLPLGVLRGLRDGVMRSQPAGFQRAGAIIGGFGATAWGYVSGLLRQRISGKGRLFAEEVSA